MSHELLQVEALVELSTAVVCVIANAFVISKIRSLTMLSSNIRFMMASEGRRLLDCNPPPISDRPSSRPGL